MTDLLFVSDDDWLSAQWHAGGVEMLDKKPGPMGPRIENLANMFEVTPRTVRRWLTLYRKNPDPISLLPRHRGPRLGHRRLPIAIEQIIGATIDAWSVRTERLPISWIVEQCARRCKAAKVRAEPSMHRESAAG